MKPIFLFFLLSTFHCYSQSISNVNFSVKKNKLILTYNVSDVSNCTSMGYISTDIIIVDENNKRILKTKDDVQYIEQKPTTVQSKKKIELSESDISKINGGKIKVIVSLESYSNRNCNLTAESSYKPINEVKEKPVDVVSIPKPTAPVNLIISNISFNDKNGNNNKILDANETADLSFQITNNGKGDAYNLVAEISDIANLKGIQFSNEFKIGNLASGKETTVIVPIVGTIKLETNSDKLRVIVKEGNHFDANPFEISFQTQAFNNPLVSIADYAFTANEGEGKIVLGKSVNLKLIIQNIGQGEANQIKVKFTNPDNVYPSDKVEYLFSNLKPNESKVINYEFFANKQYKGSEIPIQVVVNESYGTYGVSKTLKVSTEQTLAKTQQININGHISEKIAISEVSLTSDIDKNIPESGLIHKNRYALIIGNEDYSSNQSGLNTESNVDFARNDAKSFMIYCQKILGVPEDNISLLQDATVGKMKQNIDKLNKLLKNSNGKLEIIFYYAGHGLPDEKTKEPYLIPVDINGNDLQNAIKLSDLYNSLTEYPSNKVTVFLDACFSGGGRNQGLIAARGVKVKPKENMIKGNLVVYSASSGEQTSLPYKDKQHGMFTYYLLKKLQETKGDATYKELFDYLSENVSFECVKVNNKEQNPQVNISVDVNAEWGNWKFK